MKFYKEGSWVAQPIKVLEEQIALRDIRPYIEYKDSNVMKTKLQLARDIASSSGGTEALVRPNQLALLDAERNASAYAAGQRTAGQQQPANLLSRLWRGARGSSSSSASNVIQTNCLLYTSPSPRDS